MRSLFSGLALSVVVAATLVTAPVTLARNWDGSYELGDRIDVKAQGGPTPMVTVRYFGITPSKSPRVTLFFGIGSAGFSREMGIGDTYTFVSYKGPTPKDTDCTTVETTIKVLDTWNDLKLSVTHNKYQWETIGPRHC